MSANSLQEFVTIEIVDKRRIDAPTYGRHLDIGQIKDLARRAGSHYFDPDTLRFFRSRVDGYTYTGPDGWYFVTSEQFRDHTGRTEPRRYSVRRFSYRTNEAGAFVDVDFDTIGEFQEFPTLQRARTFAKVAAKLGAELNKEG